MVSEKDFRDFTFCKKLIKRAFMERNIKAIRSIFDKISPVFVFSTKDFRKELVAHIYSEVNSWPFEALLNIGRESVLGNVVVIYYVVKKIAVITPENLGMFATLLKLDHIKDSILFDFIPTNGVLILDLNERVKSLVNASTIENSIEACELFFTNARLEKSKDTIHGLSLLYENSQRPEQKFKGNIVSSLIKNRFDMFLSLLKKIYKDVEDENSFVRHYIEVYDLLLKSGVPVFFDFNSFRLEFDKFYNGNFYIALLLDKSGNEHLLMPFEQIDAVRVQQVFDIESESFVTPKGRIGKILLHSIHSFRKIREIAEVSREQVEITRRMTEDEIEKKIREILQDQNITSHSPAEKTDIYEHKLFVNNESDLRDVAIIIKGRGYPRVTLSNVASNILKAVYLPVQVVFLIHTGTLLDEAKEKFTSQCGRSKKMHSVIDPIDLTKLLIAYNKFPSE